MQETPRAAVRLCVFGPDWGHLGCRRVHADQDLSRCPGDGTSVGIGRVRPWRQVRAAVKAKCRTGTVISRSVRGSIRELYGFDLEPEVRDWLDSLSDSDYKRADEVCGLLAEKGSELGGPWSDHLEGSVWELRLRLRDVAARVTYWCTPDGRIVLLTVFRKTRQHEQRQIDRAVRAQKTCERDHRGPATETYERQV